MYFRCPLYSVITINTNFMPTHRFLEAVKKPVNNVQQSIKNTLKSAEVIDVHLVCDHSLNPLTKAWLGCQYNRITEE